MTGAREAWAQPIGATTIGEIESLQLEPGCADTYCGGTMVVAGQTVILPRNLLIDLPANRLTLRQIFQQAPAACQAAGETGLARNDGCLGGAKGALVTFFGNQDSCNQLIVGDVFIQKGPEILTGRVTFIDHANGYFRVNGTMGQDSGGAMVRINDPIGRYSLQQGPGCAGGPNCSPDPRFTSDPLNYTVSFANGYPLCIPSTLTGGARTQGADPATGAGDPFCPASNRLPAAVLARTPAAPVPDATHFAPLLLDDQVTVNGSFESVGGVRFLSANTVTVGNGITTSADPTQPDYLQVNTVVWDLPNFPALRARLRMKGATTLTDSQLDLFALRVDPTGNLNHEDPLSSTVNNPNTVGFALGGPGGIFSIALDVGFRTGAPVAPKLSPCDHLLNAGFLVCPGGGTLAEEFSIVSPPSREITARSRHRAANPGLASFDLQGALTPNGEYTRPLGISLGGFAVPGFVELNLALIRQPWIFEGLPWTLDRRISPQGCLSGPDPLNPSCETSLQPLAPYPVSRIDPRSLNNLVPPDAADRTLTFFTAQNGALVPGVLPYPPVDSCAQMAPPPPPPPVGLPNPPPVAAPLTATALAGIPVTIDLAARAVATPPATIVPGSVAIATPPNNGTAVSNGDGTVTYTPDPTFAGTDPFTFTIQDTNGLTSAPASVTVTVNDIVTITRADFTVATSTWRIDGTTSATTLQNAIQVFVGPLNGTFLGTGRVGAGGTWTLRITGPAPQVPFVSARSLFGGATNGFPVTLR